MPRIHTTRLTVGDDAIDAIGHVNNLVYLRWMQDAATAHSAAQGWTLQRYLELGAGWFVRTHFIEYLKPAFRGDELQLHTWVQAMTPRSSPRRYVFVRTSDAAPIALAETLWVFVDFASGRPLRIPPEVGGAFDLVADDDPEIAARFPGVRRRGRPRQAASGPPGPGRDPAPQRLDRAP